MKSIYLSICLLFLSLAGVKAQYRFSGQVTNEKGKGFEAVQVLLTAGDSLVAMTLTNGKGQFRMEELKSGEYEVHIHELGYSSVDEKLFVRKRDIKMDFVLLPELTGELKEVEVTANRSERVDRTATGQIFYLSEAAKNSGNAYRALKEIPKLIINESNQQISMTNGSSVLILIKFAPENTLETTFAYNKNHNRNQSTREEIYPDWLYDNYYEYKNNRSSYNLTIDYSYTWNETNSLNVGSETNLVNDRIH